VRSERDALLIYVAGFLRSATVSLVGVCEGRHQRRTNVAWAVGPSCAGFVMQHVALAAPIVSGGALKISYDVLLYTSCRQVRPPEAQAARSSRPE
jgi:hypothetical protein